MSKRLRAFAFSLGLAAVPFAGPAVAADPAAPAPQHIALRVSVDATGKVQAAQPLDANAVPAIAQAAQEIARKLQFAPAKKNGRPVASETSLALTLALEPHGGGGYGFALRRAQNGPSVVEVGKSVAPRVGRENGGMVVVGVDLLADGSVNMASFKSEQVQLRVPSSFAGERYVDFAKVSLKGTRFMLDKVDGVEIPSRISVPFIFNGGPGKRDEHENPRRPKLRADDAGMPSLIAVSMIEGIELPRINLNVPAK